jgi:hypothetical protein
MFQQTSSSNNSRRHSYNRLSLVSMDMADSTFIESILLRSPRRNCSYTQFLPCITRLLWFPRLKNLSCYLAAVDVASLLVKYMS